MLRLRSLWNAVSGSLWFVPTVIVSLMTLVAVGLVELEGVFDREQLMQRFPRLFGAGADASRGLLSAIASSMITVAGVSFSITVVALALASSQYTSRIVGNLMRDRANQTVLGVFLGIFAYCLVVLRTVRSGDEGLFVPSLAVLVGLLLAFVAVAFLIFFIHHVAASIQASSIIASTAGETLQAIDHLFPAPLGEEVEPATEPVAVQVDAIREWFPLPSPRTGYVQAVGGERLFDVAKTEEVILRLERGIGEFVIAGSPLVSSSVALSEDKQHEIAAAFALGKQRTLQQDAAYGIRQIVDVALKALSPGINDTTTAVNCIDYLGALMARLVERRLEEPYRSDGSELRLIARGPSFSDLLGLSFDQIRQSAPGNVAIAIRLLQVLTELGARTRVRERREAIEAQAQLIAEAAESQIPAFYDRRQVHEARAALMALPPRMGDKDDDFVPQQARWRP